MVWFRPHPWLGSVGRVFVVLLVRWLVGPPRLLSGGSLGASGPAAVRCPLGGSRTYKSKHTQVVTAVFCQAAVESAQNDHAAMVHSVLKNKKARGGTPHWKRRALRGKGFSCLDLFKVITFYQGKSPLNHHFGTFLFVQTS